MLAASPGTRTWPFTHGTNLSAEARSIHTEFRTQPGHDQMASLDAIQGLLWWLERQRPAWALEVGAGIGTLTAAALHKVPVVIALESDPGCIQALERRWPGCTTPASQGVGQDACWLRVKPFEWSPNGAMAHLSPGGAIPFLIVDGPVLLEHFARLGPRAAVFFEGGRRDARRVLETVLRASRRPWVSATWRPPDRSKGYTVYLLDPKIWERGWLALARGREAVRDGWGRFNGDIVGKRRPP